MSHEYSDGTIAAEIAERSAAELHEQRRVELVREVSTKLPTIDELSDEFDCIEVGGRVFDLLHKHVTAAVAAKDAEIERLKIALKSGDKP